MTSDLKSQLAVLRRRVTRIQNKYRRAGAGNGGAGLEQTDTAAEAGFHAAGIFPGQIAEAPGAGVENLLSGQIVENEHGRYFQSERFFPNHRRHGSVEFSRLAEMPGGWLEAISRGEIPSIEARRWVFLDTETTGLAGGAGTCAFLVGAGAIEDSGFRVRLFFMRDYDEEAAMLAGLAAFLADYDVLITYNGKAYDAPLLSTRFRLARMRDPLHDLAHLDLLFLARRLWKLRLATCRLIDLEYQILGVEREGDLPGEMIPYYYFEYLRKRQAFRLAPLFHHNLMDVVTLAALTAVVLPVFAAPIEADLRHGEDLLGLARWLRQSAGPEDVLPLYRRAIQQKIADHHLFRAMWEMGLMEKKLGRKNRAVEVWCELAAVHNEFQRAALEELAKHYEHSEGNYFMALEMAAAALDLEKLPELERRKQRLERKLVQAKLL
jgi:uncharacterized protein YprB with RNaseH-like and TPR domain